LNQTGGNLIPIRDQQNASTSIANNIIQKRGGSNATENKLISSNRGHSGTNRNANNSNVNPSLTS
jgi:hypothetical protein